MSRQRKTRDVQCGHCGRSFRVPTHWAQDTKRYCSHDCQRAAVEARRKATVLQGKDRTCPTCGSSFHSRYRSNKVYCRPLCRPSLRGDRE